MAWCMEITEIIQPDCEARRMVVRIGMRKFPSPVTGGWPTLFSVRAFIGQAHLYTVI
jgi:hypothetical protein